MKRQLRHTIGLIHSMSNKEPWDEPTTVTFVDYKFGLDKHGNIWQDEELTETSLKAEIGECYVLSRESNRLVFVKLKRPYSVVPYPPKSDG